MRMTKVRDFIAAVCAILLVIAFVIGVMMAMGKPVPFVSSFFGK